MSLFSGLPSPDSFLKPASGRPGGRPTKLTPEVLSTLAELLDSGVPESPTHLLKLLSDRGVQMSRPTVFKAIDKLGRNYGNIKWKWRKNYYGLPLHNDADTESCDRIGQVVGREAGISSLEKYVFADNGVLDLRTASSFCNRPSTQKPTSNYRGNEKITTDEDNSEGFPTRHFSLNRAPPSETNDDPNRSQTSIVSPGIHKDVGNCNQLRVQSSNLPLALLKKHHATDDHRVAMKEEHLTVAADSTLSPPHRNDLAHSPPQFPDVQQSSAIRNMESRETQLPSQYHPNDELLHRNVAITNYTEWIKQAVVGKPNDFIPRSEDHDLWLHQDTFVKRIPTMRDGKLNTLLPSLLPTNDKSTLAVKHRRLSEFDFDMYERSLLGMPISSRPLQSPMYPNIGNMQNTNSHISSSTSHDSRLSPHSPPRTPTSPKAKPAFQQSTRFTPYEVRSKSNPVWPQGSNATHDATQAGPQPVDRSDRDNSLSIVLQEWMQNISQRMEALEHQVQYFIDNTHSKGYTYTSNQPSSSGYSNVDDIDSKSDKQNSVVPPLNSPESEALISEVVNDCHWDQWRPFAGAPRLAIKLAKECVFGTKVLLESTVTGRNMNPLDKKGLDKIRDCLRQKYGPRCSEMEFEMIWKQSRESISQLCKRLRRRCTATKNNGNKSKEKDMSSQTEEEDENTSDKQMPNLECICNE
ncbi:uncharacterized protein [Amphiura filiformis]|uniref:uncharacterized protein n=1 Tax=Amphiura filiformis TaxID=82378 RepID=UPI003B21DF8F